MELTYKYRWRELKSMLLFKAGAFRRTLCVEGFSFGICSGSLLSNLENERGWVSRASCGDFAASVIYIYHSKCKKSEGNIKE